MRQIEIETLRRINDYTNSGGGATFGGHLEDKLRPLEREGLIELHRNSSGGVARITNKGRRVVLMSRVAAIE